MLSILIFKKFNSLCHVALKLFHCVMITDISYDQSFVRGFFLWDIAVSNAFGHASVSNILLEACMIESIQLSFLIFSLLRCFCCMFKHIHI